MGKLRENGIAMKRYFAVPKNSGRWLVGAQAKAWEFALMCHAKRGTGVFNAPYSGGLSMYSHLETCVVCMLWDRIDWMGQTSTRLYAALRENRSHPVH